MSIKVKLGHLAVRLAIFFIWFLPWYYVLVPFIHQFFLSWGSYHNMTHQNIIYWTIGTAIAISILPIAVVRMFGAQYAQKFFPALGFKKLPLKEEVKEASMIAFIFIGAYIAHSLGWGR